jgi:nucleotide-binding universal stress UspA family protein
MKLPHNILVPVELGIQTEPVLDYAVTLAAKLDAKIHLLHVVGRPLLGSEVAISVIETNMDAILERCGQQLEFLASTRASKAPFGPVLLKIGDARSIIGTTAAALGCELIVMGTHGRRGVSRVLLGSVAESVVRTACCPVLLLRTGDTVAA